jgi:hypothetical protein
MLKVLLTDREGERKREGRGWLDFGSRELKIKIQHVLCLFIRLLSSSTSKLTENIFLKV